jgi:hypothetical protein
VRHEAPAPCPVLEAAPTGFRTRVGCVTIIACRWNWWLPRRPALLLRVEPSGSCLRPTPFRSQPGDLKAGPGCRPETRAWITARPRRLVPSLRRFSPAGLLLSCRDAHLAAPRASPPKRGKRARRPRARHGDLDPPGASQAIESCKQQSSRAAAPLPAVSLPVCNSRNVRLTDAGDGISYEGCEAARSGRERCCRQSG